MQSFKASTLALVAKQGVGRVRHSFLEQVSSLIDRACFLWRGFRREQAEEEARRLAEEAEARKDCEREETDMVSQNEDDSDSDSPAVVQAACPTSKPGSPPLSPLHALPC